MSNLHAQQTLSVYQKCFILAGFILLVFLAFFPFSLYINTNYNDIFLNSLHLPGVCFFYFLCSKCTRNKKGAVAIVILCIFLVEIAQHSVGRQASWVDIANGFAGLWLGMRRTTLTALILIGFWLASCITLVFLRYDIGTKYPNFGNFQATSIRDSWYPLRPKTTITGHILYFKKAAADTHQQINSPLSPDQSDSIFARVTRSSEGYYGASFKIRNNHTSNQYSHLRVCLQTEVDDSIIIRIDDQRNPEYKERINIELPTSKNLTCQNIPLASAIQKMKDNNIYFKIQKVRNIAVFFRPKAHSNWFDIHTIQLITMNDDDTQL